MELLVPFVLHKKDYYYNGSSVFLIVAGFKIYTQMRSCMKVSNFEKNWSANVYHLRSCLCLRITMNLNLYRGEYLSIICKEN